jgi:DNA-directed RNA polymerase subunit alpha
VTTRTSRPAIDPAWPIADLELNMRAYNALTREGVTTIGQLLAMTEAQICGIRNVGIGTIDNIVAALDRHGLKLAGGAQ